MEKNVKKISRCKVSRRNKKATSASRQLIAWEEKLSRAIVKRRACIVYDVWRIGDRFR